MRVSDILETVATNMRANDAEMGKKAAQLIWKDASSVDRIYDPRTGEFAAAVIDELAALLDSSPGAIKKMMRSAVQAAEDLNVVQFQGLVEVIQNADDLRAKEVRFTLRKKNSKLQLLVVHDGKPVNCQHVLGMALPFLTTKTHQVDQQGRFGIGLKTLRRIASAIAIHSAPYHFSGDQVSLNRVTQESSLPGFYSPESETLLVLDLCENFTEQELIDWFEEWKEDGLIFLRSVNQFRWCNVKGKTRFERVVERDGWEPVAFKPLHEPVNEIRHRYVRGQNRKWRIWNAKISVPAHLNPAHKVRSKTTKISVAVPERPSQGSLYIGFKTRVPVTLNLSLDAQFDPSTAREELIENDWNNWLIDCCADVLGDVATGLLVHEPETAWKLVPLKQENVGDKSDRWLHGKFDTAFERVRNKVVKEGLIVIGQEHVPLSDLAYEDNSLSGLLAAADIEALVPGSRALPTSVRDEAERWREVLQELEVGTKVETADLLTGFKRDLFAAKEPVWWVNASQSLTANHPVEDELFGVPYWLTDDDRTVPCWREADTACPIVVGNAISAFSARWNLLDRLHKAYGRSATGKQAIEWLGKHAAFAEQIDVATELAAFAARYTEEPIKIGNEDLRKIRDCFDELPERSAAEIGPSVGSALLLDGFIYKGGKPQKQKVSPVNAYLCRTLDGRNSEWPTVAGTNPEIKWVAASYKKHLKVSATRTSRHLANGTIFRGPRKFLMLLGVECTPRLVKIGPVRWGRPTRVEELHSAGAEEVTHDFTSPDLKQVLVAMKDLQKNETKDRSPALIRTLSRNWERVYGENTNVPSLHQARVHSYDKAPVTADWLIDLREDSWIVIGRGKLVPPTSAVIKTAETQTLYKSNMFAVGVAPKDIGDDFSVALGLITKVRISDLIKHLVRIRDGDEPIEESVVLQIYRNIARFCPKSVSWHTLIDDMTVQALRAQFSEGAGLIHSGNNVWQRPADLLRGQDIFHNPDRFVPRGAAYSNLWSVLDVSEPSLDDCIGYYCALAAQPYKASMTATLIDIFRYIEPLLPSASRSQKYRLKKLPLNCSESWEVERQIYYTHDPELRDELAKTLPEHRFWTPPCDMRDLPNLIKMTQVTKLHPVLQVVDDTVLAQEQGDAMRNRFGQAVEHLSNELARNDSATREKISISWDQLKAIPLFVYNQPIAVEAKDEALSANPVQIERRALLTGHPTEFHVCVDALPKREYCGRAVASLFPVGIRRNIEAEWCVSWLESTEVMTDGIRLASDETLKEELEEQAEKINSSPKAGIKVSVPVSRSPGSKPRTLKETVGTIVGATVSPGSPPKPTNPSGRRPLSSTAPDASQPSSTQSSSFVAYTNADLEQRGWEILEQVLNDTQNEQRLVDFRKRHGVGADGAINWKTFVELKATGRSPQSSIKMSNSEYERAKERGKDFILALVSGLEEGQTDEVRLIFDPANSVSTRPVNGIYLVKLQEAPAVVVQFEDLATEKSTET